MRNSGRGVSLVMRICNYALGYRVVSLALDAQSEAELLARGLDVLRVRGPQVILLPSGCALSDSRELATCLSSFNSFDVFEVWEDGTLVRQYDDSSNDNYLFVTGRCNSNCIMCPSPIKSRMKAAKANIPELIGLAKHVPTDTPHLTITGGEPFLAGEEIFSLIRYLRDHFPMTEFLFLTNGRVFALDKYVGRLKETIPQNALMAIPLHGSCPEIHDGITQSRGSFAQTVRGLESLLRTGIPIEIRLVVNKLNIDDFDNIVDLILSKLQGIEYVSVIAMEMTGSARANKDEVWIPYRESFALLRRPLRKLLEGGVDVKLYNYPLCTVEKPFWALCEKSISPSKVRFGKVCGRCKYLSSCSGVFAGTLKLEESELEALA